MIGIIGAMDVEVQSLIGIMQEKEEQILSGNAFYRGKIDGKDVVVARAGIGKVAAAVTAEAMILRFAPELLLNTGVGGALSPSLRIGDIVISDRAVQYDMDTSPLGDPIGWLSGINRVCLDADGTAVKALAESASDIGVRATVGMVASGDRFVASAEAKAAILNHFPDAAVCEMEGGAIAHAAYLNGTPFVIVRAISDSADATSAMDYPTFVAMAAERSFRMIRAFLRRV